MQLQTRQFDGHKPVVFSLQAATIVAVALTALIFFAIGFGDVGYLEEDELLRAKQYLEHRPPESFRLTSQLEALLYRIFDYTVFGLRLTGSVAVACLALLAGLLVHQSERSRPSWAWVTSLLLVALPGVFHAGAFATGFPLGECLLSAGLVALIRPGQRIYQPIVSAVCFGLATIELGPLLGLALPSLVCVHLTAHKRTYIWCGAAALGIALFVYTHVTQDYMSWSLFRHAPADYTFTKPLIRLGAQLHHFLPLILIGLCIVPHWVRTWMLLATVGLVLSEAHSGTPHFVGFVPSAICASAAARYLAQGSLNSTHVRAAWLIVLLATLIVSKDASSFEQLFTLPLHHDSPLIDQQGFLNLKTSESLLSQAVLLKRISFGLLAVLAICNLSRARLGRLTSLPGSVIFSSATSFSSATLFGSATLASVLVYLTLIVFPIVDSRTTHATFVENNEWVAAYSQPPQIAVLNPFEPGYAFTRPWPSAHHPANIDDLADWLQGDGPRIAVLPFQHLGWVHRSFHELDRPLFVLTAKHPRYITVANKLPEQPPSGRRALEPFVGIVHKNNPNLANKTRVEFANNIRLVGWEIDGQPERGGQIVVRVAFEILGSVKASASVYTRLYQGRLSLLNPRPHSPANGLYPASLWQRGDFIVDEYAIDIPRLTTMSGPHDFIVGVDKAQHQPMGIVFPNESDVTEYDVQRLGKEGAFAKIATIDIE